jgi:hypothetical protein
VGSPLPELPSGVGLGAADEAAAWGASLVAAGASVVGAAGGGVEVGGAGASVVGGGGGGVEVLVEVEEVEVVEDEEVVSEEARVG